MLSTLTSFPPSACLASPLPPLWVTHHAVSVSPRPRTFSLVALIVRDWALVDGAVRGSSLQGMMGATDVPLPADDAWRAEVTWAREQASTRQAAQAAHPSLVPDRALSIAARQASATNMPYAPMSLVHSTTTMTVTTRPRLTQYRWLLEPPVTASGQPCPPTLPASSSSLRLSHRRTILRARSFPIPGLRRPIPTQSLGDSRRLCCYD